MINYSFSQKYPIPHIYIRKPRCTGRLGHEGDIQNPSHYSPYYPPHQPPHFEYTKRRFILTTRLHCNATLCQSKERHTLLCQRGGWEERNCNAGDCKNYSNSILSLVKSSFGVIAVSSPKSKSFLLRVTIKSTSALRAAKY